MIMYNENDDDPCAPRSHVFALSKYVYIFCGNRTCMDKETIDTTEYDVEDVISIKRVEGVDLYEIKWSGYPSSENKFEPWEHLGTGTRLRVLDKFNITPAK